MFPKATWAESRVSGPQARNDRLSATRAECQQFCSRFREADFAGVKFKAGSAFGSRLSVVRVRPCRAMGASAIHVRCMGELTEDDVREIEQIHTTWIEFEVAGEDHSLMALCADDIELWPPNATPLLGWAAVSAQIAHGTTRIHGIEITDRRIRGSNEIAYLTASYKTTFSSAEDSI